MMKIYLYLLSFISLYYTVESVQPYFPPQIVFSPDNGITIFAIDEINQRAYTAVYYGSTKQETSFAAKNFPYAVPDSPQSKYYVQLLLDPPTNSCQYGTYWKYGGNNYNKFPSHWWTNISSFEIKNYIEFYYGMIHSKNSSVDEDHWYSNVTCRPDSGEIVPCEEIYFKKTTDIPLRHVVVVRRGWDLIQLTTPYKVISIGKPDDKYFDSIPKNWSIACQDVNLGLLFYPQITKLNVGQSTEIHITLTAPPHRTDSNDTVSIQWNASPCNDCFTWRPKVLYYNGENFQKEQVLTITRVKDGPQTNLVPVFNGGGYNLIPAYYIFIQ